MQKHVAFLRAINVGGRRIKMDELRRHIVDLGLADVDTYLASGNIIFESDENRDTLEAQIAAHLEDVLEYEVPTFVRTLSKVAGISESPAFAGEADEDGRRLYVCFLDRELTDVTGLDELQTEVDSFVADGREIYWLRDIEAGDSIPTGDLEETLGVVATRRNINTVRRIVAKYH